MATDAPSIKFLNPHWQTEYASALLETVPQKLSARVEAAETAIYKRLQQILQDPDHYTERQAIEDALNGLSVLKRDQPKFPNWEKK